MASSSASSQYSSRAIKIPHAQQPESSYKTAARQRIQNTRYSKLGPNADNADNASTSPGSEQDSWPASPASTHMTSITLPATLTHLPRAPRPLVSESYSSTSSDKRKDKAPVYSSTPPPTALPSTAPSTMSSRPILTSSPSTLGPSMLTSSSYKSVNLNEHRDYYDPDDPPRLITYTKSAQGFTWNDELFLPSYLLGSRYGFSSRRRRERWGDDEWIVNGDEDHCPVTEIFVTDEEAERMMP